MIIRLLLQGLEQGTCNLGLKMVTWLVLSGPKGNLLVLLHGGTPRGAPLSMLLLPKGTSKHRNQSQIEISLSHFACVAFPALARLDFHGTVRKEWICFDARAMNFQPFLFTFGPFFAGHGCFIG